MTEPTTPLKALIVPNTGDLVGSWGTTAVNADWTAVDGMLGGSQTLGLSSATTFTLSAPAGAITPGAGPNQAQNAFLQLSGTLSGNASITLPLPGRYVVFNSCVVGANFVQMRAVGTGTVIGIPDGRPIEVWCDGTNVNFCDQPEVASYLDLAMATTPSWFAGCSMLPYLICDGSIYTSSLYPVLAQRLGSNFGGNGITTFGVPDARSRANIPLDNQGRNGAAGRVTAGGSGIQALVIGASGGSEFLQVHNHGFSGTQQTWSTNEAGSPNIGIITVQVPGGGFGLASNARSPFTITITPAGNISNAGAGGSQNMIPTLISGLRLIKT